MNELKSSDTNLQIDLWREKKEQRKFLGDFGEDFLREVKEDDN